MRILDFIFIYTVVFDSFIDNQTLRLQNIAFILFAIFFINKETVGSFCLFYCHRCFFQALKIHCNHDIFCAAQFAGLVNAGAVWKNQANFRRRKKSSLYSLCGHTLNLAAYDIVKQSKIKDSLDITSKISKLVEFSPKHASRFEKLKQDLAPMHSPGLRVLCLTR